MPHIAATTPSPADYRRGREPGEAAVRAGSRRGGSDAATNRPKETTMFRTLATTAILTMTMALTWSTAQADTLSDRIQAVAQAACAVERVSRGLPASHYSAIYRH